MPQSLVRSHARQPARHCQRCDATVPASVPSPLWKVALPLGIVMVFVSTLTAYFIGTAIFVLVPVYLLIGCCLGPLHHLATERATCLRCGGVVNRLPDPLVAQHRSPATGNYVHAT